MALPAKLLERLAPDARSDLLGSLSALGVASLGALPSSNESLTPEAELSRLPLGWAELDALLPDGGLPLGAVVEVSVPGLAAGGTSLALAACRAAQERGRTLGEVPWCAFVDPSRTLHAGGVQQAGVELTRLLVVQPSVEQLARTAVRLAEARSFAVLVVDTVGAPGATLPDGRPFHVGLGSWPRTVRQLSLALQGARTLVLLLTDAETARPLPLPVAQRLELRRASPTELQLRVAKDRLGRSGAYGKLAWARRPFLHSGTARTAVGA